MVTLIACLFIIIILQTRRIRAFRKIPSILLDVYGPACNSVMVWMLIHITPAVMLSEVISSWTTAWWGFMLMWPSGWWAGYLAQNAWTARVLLKMDQFSNAEQRAYMRAHESNIKEML
jgi:hypothetical protein